MPNRILIYGAHEHRGERLARSLADVGLRPLLGGPDGVALAGLSHALSTDVRLFSHTDPRFALAGLAGVELLVNCAGDWASTTPALVEACLQTGTHYLDASGAWDVLEGVARLDELARKREVTLLPGLTFEALAGDCLAAQLVRMLPGASHLELAVHVPGGLSEGTVDALLRHLRRGGLIRSAGAWKAQRVGSPWREIDFGLGPVRCMALPLPPLVMLAHSVRVPNVIVYGAVTTGQELALRACRRGWFLGPAPFRALLGRGGGDRARERQRPPGSVFCELRDDLGRTLRARLHTQHVDALEDAALLAAARHLLAGRAPVGHQTPSGACGPDFVLRLPDVVRTLDEERPDPHARGAATLEPARGLG